MRTQVAVPWALGMLLVVLVSGACSGTVTGPGDDSPGLTGSLPAGLSGKLAFVKKRVITNAAGAAVHSVVYVVDMVTATARAVYATDQVSVEELTWAPDGDHLVIQTFALRPGGPNGENRSIRQLQRIHLDGGLGDVIFDGEGPEYKPTYGTDGRLAYFGGWDTDPDHGLFIDGEPVMDVGWITNNTYLAWLPDGSGLILTDQTTGIMHVSLIDREVRQLVPTANGEVTVTPAVSPDGARIVAARYAGASGDGEIWTFGVAGDSPMRLTTGFADHSPQWTSGGRYIAFSRSGPNGGIYVMAPDGGTPVRIVAADAPGSHLSSLAWSR